jgi:hypothetical protein
MRNAKTRLFGILVGVALLCGAVVVTLEPITEAAQNVELKQHWRHHDGHWSYWYPADKAWYYTDGTNWYYNNGNAWNVYRFDKGFGREGFERGEYKVPAEGAKIVVPNHGVWVPK